ncbi:hypothetical protein FBQ82_07745 [Anaerolineae bacterium CFX7]|nr:hypothetical protein [Anaerolineae bacterium CFX7]
MRARRQHAAFHPNAPQTILAHDARVFAVLRFAPDERGLCLHNVTAQTVVFEWRDGAGAWRDILTGDNFQASATLRVELKPYAVRWLFA